MSQLLNFQMAFARLVTDAEMRQAVFAGDMQPLAELGLSPEQQHYFLEMDFDRVEIFSRFLVTNRLGKAIDGLPWTTKLLGDELGAIAFEFNQKSPPRDAKKYREALAFGQYLERRFRLEPPAQRYLPDVLNYELSVMEIRFDVEGYRDAASAQDHSSDIGLLGNPESAAKVMPYPLNIRVVGLNYDVPAIGKDLEKGKTISRVREQPMLVLLKVDSLGLVVETKVNYRTFAFIRACNGSTPLREILERLAQEFREDHPRRFPKFQKECLSLCKSLVENGILGLEYRSLIHQTYESTGYERLHW